MALIALELKHPVDGWLYKATTPKILVDGAEFPGSDWGRNGIQVAPGAHRLEVYVPYVLPRRAGRAVLDLTVPEVGVALEYMAPSVTFAKGSLGTPGQQKSTGSKPIRITSFVIIGLVVAYYLLR
ncbi:hypothetical protein AB0M02_42405 [Actinoplanes sp. NPDC051861]|uniref:hypothetical protein n=1 Tax=Actinoplanes sp. NPDC051861 TaxID=3155170 RepID=UPI0034472512